MDVSLETVIDTLEGGGTLADAEAMAVDDADEFYDYQIVDEEFQTKSPEEDIARATRSDANAHEFGRITSEGTSPFCRAL